MLERQGKKAASVLHIEDLENASTNMGLEGTNIRDICQFLRSFDENGDGEVDIDEFRIMLKSAWQGANMFTGNETAFFLTDRQLDALILYEWPTKDAGVSEADESSGLGGFLEQMQREQKLIMHSGEVQQDLEYVHKRQERENKMNKGDRSDPQLMMLDELAEELQVLHSSCLLEHYPHWKMDLIEAEDVYIESPEALSLCVSRLRVKKLERTQKQARVQELAQELYATGVTAIPPQIWNEDSGSVDPDEEERILRRLGFIFKAYRADFWWWEATEMTRKFMMTSLLIFVYPDDPAQMAAGAMITFAFLMLNITFQPFCSKNLNSLQSFTMLTQVCICVVTHA